MPILLRDPRPGSTSRSGPDWRTVLRSLCAVPSPCTAVRPSRWASSSRPASGKLKRPIGSLCGLNGEPRPGLFDPVATPMPLVLGR